MKKGFRKYDKTTRLKGIVRYAMGESASALVKEMGICRKTFYNWKEEFGLGDEDSREEWLEKYNSERLAVGMIQDRRSTEEIEVETGLSEYQQRKVGKAFRTRGFFKGTKYDDSFAAQMISFYRSVYRKLKKAIESGDKKKQKVGWIDLITLDMYVIEHLQVTPRLAKIWASKGDAQREEGDKFKLDNKGHQIDYRNFSAAWEICKQIYEDVLMQCGLYGVYQPNIAMFIAKNKTSLKDIKAVELTGKDGKDFHGKIEDMSDKRMSDLNELLGISAPTEEGDVITLENMSEKQAKTTLKHVSEASSSK